jgi:anti-sigma B factor antagonist
MNRISTSAFTLEQRERESGSVVLSLQGELDLSVAIEARRLLEQELESGHDVVIDLAGLEFVDSTGLVTLLRASERAAVLERQLQVTGPYQIQVQRLLRLTGLDQKLPLATLA